MRYRIKLLPEVHNDLRKAKKWYNDKQEFLGEEFKQEVNKEIEYIGQNPEHYQLKYNALRQSLVTRFPYAIFYQVEESERQIVIFGILHMGRSPEVIRKRINE